MKEEITHENLGGICSRGSLSLAMETSEALRFRITKSRDIVTGNIAYPFARSPTPLTHLLASYCSLYLYTPLCSFVRLLAHFHTCTKK